MARIISKQQLKGRQKGIIIQVKPPGPSTSPSAVVEKTQEKPFRAQAEIEQLVLHHA